MVSFDDVRTALADRFRVVTAALSADGREVLLTGPVDVGLEVGGFAVVELDDERRLAVQVRSVRIVEKKRNQLAIRLEGAGDLLLENWALKRKAPLFAKAFKAKLTFRGATEN